MRRLLRHISFPTHLHISTPVIKGRLLNHVSNYQELIEQAELEAQRIVDQAHRHADLIKEQVRLEVAQSVRHDLVALQSLTSNKEERLQRRTAGICTEVCLVVLEKFIEGSSDLHKIKTLAEALVLRSHSARELRLRVNQAQLEMVKEVLSGLLAQQMNLRKWDVQADEEVGVFELKIQADNGAEINVSLDNLLAIYKDEIQQFERSLQPLIEGREEIQ